MDIKQEIYTTSQLLNISISEDEIKKLEKSFTALLEYFTVMQKAVENLDTDTALSVHSDISGIGRADVVQTYEEEPSALIEKSEEHEDNFVLIPNVL